MPRNGRGSRGGRGRTTQPVRTRTTQVQGDRQAAEEAQRAIPLPRRPGPGERGAFTRPTERPNEPVTAGLSTGPGPGREVQRLPVGDPVAAQIRALHQYFPNRELGLLVELLDNQGR